MSKPLSRGFVFGWYCWCALLIVFMVVSFSHLVAMSKDTPTANVTNAIIIDVVGLFPALWFPLLWHNLSKGWKYVLVGCVVVLVGVSMYTNILAWR